LTKLHEEIAYGSLTELIERFSGDVRGELVIVVGGEVEPGDAPDDVETLLRSLLATGMKTSVAAREAASMTGKPRSELYEIAERLRKGGNADH
jgi:16S rRNA (cytidine1402-2'-O)-methyltransferase